MHKKKKLLLAIGEWIDDNTFKPERLWNLDELTAEQKETIVKVISQFGFENI